MYSHKDRIKAVEIYLKYGKSLSATINKLGYPSIRALRKWCKEHEETEELHQNNIRKEWKYRDEEKCVAVKHYLEHGQCLARTIRLLGYPNKTTLRKWINQMTGYKSSRKKRSNLINYTKSEKEAAVLALCSRTDNETAYQIAEEVGVTRQAVYKWKEQMLGKDVPCQIQKQTNQTEY